MREIARRRVAHKERVADDEARVRRGAADAAALAATADRTQASAAIVARHRADAATEQAQRRERIAADAVVEPDDPIARAGPVVTPAQEAVAAEAKRTTAPWAAIARSDGGGYGD